MNREEPNTLSEFAAKHGLHTNWRCWESGRVFDDLIALIEICERIEAIEDRLEEHLWVEKNREQ
jgi:hypothetical protein